MSNILIEGIGTEASLGDEQIQKQKYFLLEKA